jgi:hypothetical protein
MHKKGNKRNEDKRDRERRTCARGLQEQKEREKNKWDVVYICIIPSLSSQPS